MRYEDASGAFQASGPIANDDADTLSAGQRGPATGNLISGEGTQYGAAGADSAAGAHVTAIAGKGGEDTSFSGGKLSVAGEHGRLTVDADGNYSYLATGNAENVRDRFTYTLADGQGNSDTAALIVEIGKTPAVIKANAQQIVPGPDGVVTLPPGVELSDVHVVGRNLVVDLPDGSQLVILDGAIFVPQLVLGGVEVPATNVAALLIGQEVQPAAGETPPSGGGNFALPPPPLDPGIPLGDLIPPTEYDYVPPEPEEVFDVLDREPEIFVQPDGQPASVAAVDQVEEAGLPTRNGGEPAGSAESADGNGGDNDVASETTTGTIVYNSPDGVDSIVLTGFNGDQLAITGPAQVGQTVNGQYGTLTITSVAPGVIGYSYTLHDNSSGNDTHDDFSVVLTDSDGDVASATLTIDIIDDVPTARPDTDAIAAGQFGPVTGNVITDASAGDAGDGDNGADTVGADNASITAVSSVNVPANSDNGAPFVVNGQYGVLTLQSDGSYSYTRNEGTPGGVEDVFNYTLTDGDGDTSTTTLTITIADATPETRPNPTALLDDDALAGGNPGGVGDDPNSADVSGNLTGVGGDGPLAFNLLLTGAPAGFSYVSGGDGVLLVQQGGVTVLTVTVNSATGAYTVVQNAPIDHPAGSDENNSLFTFNYTVTDQDGDSAPGTISVNVDDDTPLANNDTDTVSDGTATGNVITGVGTTEGGANADSPGADGFDAITQLASNNVPANSDSNAAGGFTVQGQYGSLQMDANGGYTYTRGADTPGGVSDVFTYTYRDGDGDLVSATLTIEIPDLAPTLPDPAAVLLDDDALAGGNAGGTGDDVNSQGTPGQLAGSGGDGDLDYNFTGVNGLPAGFSVNVVNAGQVQILQGATVVLTVTLDNETGAYSVVQNNPIDHPAGSNENNLSFSIGVEVEDVDGDTEPATITINVDDDTPIAANDTDSIPSGSNGPATGNVITDAAPGDAGDSDNGADSVGADGGAAIVGLASNNVPANVDNDPAGGFVVEGQFGTLTMQADGSYSYARNDGQGAGQNEVFTYTLTDGDGDTTTATLTISIADATPTLPDPAAVLLDDDALAGGNAGGTGDDVDSQGTPGQLVGSGGDGDLDYGFTGLNSLPAGFSVNVVNAGQVQILQGATVVLTVTLDNETGSFSVVQNNPIDHPAGLDENNLSFSIGVQVQDADGDAEPATITINVDDDTPVASLNGQASLDQLVVDETRPLGSETDGDSSPVGIASVQANFADNFTGPVAYGADGAGSTSYALALSANGIGSGLYALDPTDTSAGDGDGFGQGAQITLSQAGNTITGSAGGVDYFTMTIDPVTGVVTFTQLNNVWHSNTANDDDTSSLMTAAAANIQVVQTVTDADGDSATASLDIGQGVFHIEDDGPEFTNVDAVLNIDNDADPSGTGDLGFDLGSDGPSANNNVISVSNFAVSVNGVPLDPSDFNLVEGSETATTASYSFSFTYNTGSGGEATANGTLVFDKAAGTYTVDLDGPIQGFSILQTATGTLFQGYQFGSSTEDGSQPEISVTQIQGTPGNPQPDDLFIQFTSVAEPSSGTGDDNLEVTNWVPGADNVAPVDGGGDSSWSAGQLFNQDDGWVSTSNTANGVNGDTIQGGEVLDFNLVQGANPTGVLAQPEDYGQASSMFLKFDGIGTGEDMIVVLKLYDPDADVYTTKAVMIQNSDIQKGPGTGPGIYNGISLDNNDGLVIIESNDYNGVGENWVIVGAQIAGSDEGITGTAINLNSAIGDAGGSSGTQAFSTDTNDGPFKISSIGFVTENVQDQSATLDFDVTITEADGDSETQSVSVNIGDAQTLAAPLASANSFSTQEANEDYSSLAAGGESQKLAANSNVGNTGVVSSMVAASGLAALSTVSLNSFDEPLLDTQVQDSLEQYSTKAAAREVEDSDLAGSSSGAELGGSAADAVSPSSSGFSFNDHGFGGHGLERASGDAEPAYEPSYASGESADVGVAALAANVPAVSMASAEILQAAGLAGNAQQGASVEQVLAEALDGGAPTIDGVLANLPGGIAELAAIANLASPDGTGVPAWDMGMHGGFAPAHDMMFKVEAAVIHQDAVQPA